MENRVLGSTTSSALYSRKIEYREAVEEEEAQAQEIAKYARKFPRFVERKLSTGCG
jgi:hypothetical protein